MSWVWNTARKASAQGRSLTPSNWVILEISSRDDAGRRAAVGYSDVAIGITLADGPPYSAETLNISVAKPAQLVSPVFAK